MLLQLIRGDPYIKRGPSSFIFTQPLLDGLEVLCVKYYYCQQTFSKQRSPTSESGLEVTARVVIYNRKDQKLCGVVSNIRICIPMSFGDLVIKCRMYK